MMALFSCSSVKISNPYSSISASSNSNNSSSTSEVSESEDNTLNSSEISSNDMLSTNNSSTLLDQVEENGVIYKLAYGEVTVAGHTDDMGSSIVILSKVTINGQKYSVLKINDNAFAKCESLESVTIQDGLRTIGNHAFDGCVSLKNVTFPYTIQSFYTSAFANCTALESINLPTRIKSIGWSSFEGCRSLKSIIIPRSVTEMGPQVFQSCSSLTIYCQAEIKPESWTNRSWDGSRPVYWGIKDEDVIMTQDAIYYLVTKDEAIVTGRSLELRENVTIPSEVTLEGKHYSVTKIIDKSFYYCNFITNITLPNGLLSIGEKAFGECYGLKYIVIPSSVSFISVDAFFLCSKLVVYCEAESQPEGWDSDWGDYKSIYWKGQWSYVNGIPSPNN